MGGARLRGDRFRLHRHPPALLRHAERRRGDDRGCITERLDRRHQRHRGPDREHEWRQSRRFGHVENGVHGGGSVGTCRWCLTVRLDGNDLDGRDQQCRLRWPVERGHTGGRRSRGGAGCGRTLPWERLRDGTDVVLRRRNHHGAGEDRGDAQLRQSGPRRERPASRAVRGRRHPVGVAGLVGIVGSGGRPGSSDGLPGARGPGRGGALLRHGHLREPAGVLRVRRHL